MKRPSPALLSLMLCLAASASAFDLGNLDPSKLANLVKKGIESSRPVPEEKEIQMGRDISAGLLGAAPLVDDAPLQTYVNSLGRWLALQSERPDLPWTFGVIDTDTVNAFATPGGYIFITKGLFLILRNEAELAGVLSHEIVHVVERHHLEAIKKQLRTSMATDAASMLVEYDEQMVDALVGAGMKLYARGLDRADEFEADRRGVVIAARGGYDPYGLPAMLLTLNAMGDDDQNLAFMFSTHPPTSDRLALLDEQMGGRMDRYSGGAVDSQQFATLQKRLRVAAQ